MPSDIRNFFGGKSGGPGPSASSEKNISNAFAKEPKPKDRRKRKVVSDSDDEGDVQPKQNTTPQKPPLKRQLKETSPVGEVTTSSDYFASSGKSKPARSTPSKASSNPKQESAADSEVIFLKPTPVSESQINDVPAVDRKSPRQMGKPQYAELDEGGDDHAQPRVIKDNVGSAKTIFEAGFKDSKSERNDLYEDDDDDDDVVLPPSRISAKRSDGTRSRKTATLNNSGPDISKTEISNDSTQITKRRKRKSAELGGGEDEDNEVRDIPVSKNSRSPKPQKSAKKATPQERSRKDYEPIGRTEVDEIFESITKVRAPSPPPREEGRKFNYTAFNADRANVPSSNGSVSLPEGADNCLAGLTFVFTGVLEGLGREQGQELVKRYGGKTTGAPSKKTSFVVLGADAGPKKLETIRQYCLKTINEKGLFELIERLPANGGDGKAAEHFEAKQKREEALVEKAAEEMARQERAEAKQAAKAREAANSTTDSFRPKVAESDQTTDSRLWTVKYAPTATSMICGNKTQVEKLQAWLRAWPSSLKSNFKKPGKDGWGAFRAMCLHGPPGIGKTTAAHLAARLEGYDILESNASDTRSKKLVETGLRGVLNTTSLLGYFSGDGKKVESEKKRLVLVMDEVDGMSAGDRGGVGALAAVCRKNRIPIILICNDRKLPKMKPFDHVAYDLPFRRPTVDMIRQRIMTICFREKLKIPPNVINALIEGSHSDIRQVINMLSTAKLDQEALDFNSGKEMSKSWEKHVVLRPWDIVSKILGGGLFAPTSTFTLNDKIELYFNDHEFSSLMLQENYLGTNPMLSNKYIGKEKSVKILELADQAAESISDGDLVDRMIHGSQQQWALMPVHAVLSFVRPASFVAGSQAGSQTRFTAWLGNNSKHGKLMRSIKEIQGHMRLRASGDRHEIRQQYLPLLWYRLVKELQVNGKDVAGDMIDLMDSYFLTKDDWDAILELGVGPLDMEHIKIDTQAKSAFTRTYNQMSHPLPYMKASQVVAPKKKSREKPDIEDALEESDSEASSGGEQIVLEEDEPLDLKKDKYVVAPRKKKTTAKGKSSGVKAKGKGRTREASDDDAGIEDESEEDTRPRKGGGGKGKKNGRTRK